MRRDSQRYEHLIAFCLEHPWAVTPSMRAIIAGVLARRLAFEDDDPAGIVVANEMRATRDVPVATGGSVAVIPMFGVIAPRMNMFSDISGGTSFEALGKQLATAVADPNVKSVVFDVDSPGGNVAGATEFAREVLKARTQKPIYAQAHPLMASAAYWAMSCATEVCVSPSALVGGIGVYHLHDDISEALGKMGVKRTVTAAGKYKAEGVDGGPLSDEAKAHIAALVEGSYGRFVGDVAKGRGTTPAKVRSGYGEGRVVPAEEALACGLIDRIGTMADTLARASAQTTPGFSRATADAPPTVTTQEPATRATVQEPPAVIAASFVGFEARVLELQRRRV